MSLREMRAKAGEATADALGGGGCKCRGILAVTRSAAPPLHLRRTAGCLPSAARAPPAPVRRRHARRVCTRTGTAIRRSSFEPRKIAVKGGARGVVTYDALRAPLTAIFSAPYGAYRLDGQNRRWLTFGW
jgi:hypothetical protein